jgi:hypothetical protein
LWSSASRHCPFSPLVLGNRQCPCPVTPVTSVSIIPGCAAPATHHKLHNSCNSNIISLTKKHCYISRAVGDSTVLCPHIMASLNTSTNGPSIKASYQGVINGPAPSGPAAASPTYAQWAVFSVTAPLVNTFQPDNGSKESVLKVQTTGGKFDRRPYMECFAKTTCRGGAVRPHRGLFGRTDTVRVCQSQGPKYHTTKICSDCMGMYTIVKGRSCANVMFSAVKVFQRGPKVTSPATLTLFQKFSMYVFQLRSE